MNQAPPNKLFQPKYRAQWPTAVQALAHLEKCGERVALLIADGLGADDPRLVAARDEAKRASADYSRAERADVAMRFQSLNAPSKEEICIGRIDPQAMVKCLCGMWLGKAIDRCPGCNSKRRAG